MFPSPYTPNMFVVASTLVALCVPFLFIAYKRIRPYFSVRVNCWFCGKSTVVPYGNINCWDCPSCEQYNGFHEDGDYNKPIPSQYDESLNFAFTSSHNDSCGDALQLDSENGLCPTCNYKQLVKIRLLANFTPLREEDYDEEMKAYREHVERVYDMCHECEMHVQRKLTEQDSFLWPQVRSFYLASGQMLQTYGVKEQLKSIGAHVTGVLSAAVATLRAVELLQKRETGIASPLVMRIAGTAFAFGSVLVAGRSQFGPSELLLCWFWLVFHLFSNSWIMSLMEEQQLCWLQATVAGIAAVLALLRLSRSLLCSAGKKNWTFRKLTSRPAKSTPISASCESFQTVDPKPVRSESGTEIYGRGDTTGQHPPLHDLLDNCHISPEGKKAESSSPRSNFSNKSHVFSDTNSAMEGSRPERPLLWPPRLSPPPSRGGSWMVGGAWAVGGSHSGKKPEITWGMKETYAVLTPPPSTTGSASSFCTAAAAPEKTAFKSFQSFGNCPRPCGSWLNLRSRTAPHNFYSATSTKPVLGSGPSAFTAPSPIHGVTAAWSSRSLCSGEHQRKSPPLAKQRSLCAANLPTGRSYAASSVSQNSSVVQSSVSPSSGTYSGAHSHKGGRFSCPHMLLLASIITNVSLFAYFVAVPAVVLAWH